MSSMYELLVFSVLISEECVRVACLLSVLQASCIWLLTVLKRCRYRPEVQRTLTQIQGAFMDLLADTNGTDILTAQTCMDLGAPNS